MGILITFGGFLCLFAAKLFFKCFSVFSSAGPQANSSPSSYLQPSLIPFMRPPVQLEKLQALMAAMGRSVKSPGRVYLTGGATALLHGWRPMTVEVDLKADPEPAGFFEAIAVLKDKLAVNIELASPADFIPELPHWRERSLFIARHGLSDFYHYDPYSQALSKLERGHSRDLTDVDAMLRLGLIGRDRLFEQFLQIEAQLIRYPALDTPSAARSRNSARIRPAPRQPNRNHESKPVGTF